MAKKEDKSHSMTAVEHNKVSEKENARKKSNAVDDALQFPDINQF